MTRAYRLVWSAAALSGLADGVLKVALPLVAVGVTRSPALVAGLAFAVTLPWLLFALPAGAFVDRVDRRRAMAGANTLRAVLLGALVAGLLAGVATIWLLYLVAFCVGIAETVHDTAAQSIVPQVVARDRLPVANARLYAAELTANQFAGPPLAGALVVAGAAAPFVGATGLWLAAAAALLPMRGSFRVARPPDAAGAGIRAEIVEGVRWLWRQRLLRTFAAMVGVSNFASNAAFAVLVVYAVGPGSAMGLSAPEYGWLLTALAVGSLLGSLLSGPVVRALGRARGLAVALTTAAALVGVPALTTNPFTISASFVVGGAGIVIANVVMVSLRQSITPDHLLGRVNSCYRLVAWGTMPLGAATGGLLAEAFGVRPVFAIMGVLVLTTLLGLRTATNAAMEAAEAAADVVVPAQPTAATPAGEDAEGRPSGARPGT
ncbi:MFS transporter [Dactylosporangium sp. AC04546]|uniref:MFS transporter n=1 Tax=Dactylosporangium sp. AC04546 TaxID=2862460 RepID=UPI001EE06CEE|nr:MFS transporter [Dactylosporangium sp. AC04546]WVK86277.1 MFS transporter [Dactylosporangium sp. AC04546]